MRKMLALVLISLVVLPPQAFAQGDVWATVQDLPSSTRLKLTLTDGSEVTGSVVEVLPDAVRMVDNKTRSRTLKASSAQALSSRGSIVFSRSDVTAATVVKMAQRYSVSGDKPPNPASVRHVVTALRVGKKVEMHTTRGKRDRARITSINSNGFAIADGRGSAPVTVAYQDVRDIKPAGMSVGGKIAIGVGSVFGLSALVLATCYSRGTCGD